MLTAATFDHVGLRSRIPTSTTSISWVRVTPTTDTIEYLMASAPRPPVTRSRTAAGDIFTASDPTGPTLRFPNQPGGPRTGAPPGLREDVQMSQDAVDDLVKLLDLEPIELNRSEEHTSELQSLMRIS